MSIAPVGTEHIGTLTVSASGTGMINPVQSNSPYKNLSITVRPFEDNSPYKVDVYHNGELEETHTYIETTGKIICHMAFPNFVFAADVGTAAIPKVFEANRANYLGTPIRVDITNNASGVRVFEVYAMFEAWDECRFGVIAAN